MFDTHCHLQFKAFEGKVEEVLERAKKVGVTQIVVPGTSVETSKKAVKIADRFENIFAAVGIHPHHVYEHQTKSEERKTKNNNEKLKTELKQIEKLLSNNKVVAVGEVGVDRHYYSKTKYTNYQITNEFIALQKEVLRQQIELAIKYKKSLILHNREAKKDLLEVLAEFGELRDLEGRIVFHCCEPEEELLKFAQKHKIFIGVDGDVTYDKKKKEFVKKLPLDLLVLETDSPFLTPEPLRSGSLKRPINEPQNLKIIAEFIAQLKNVSTNQIIKTTTENARKLFKV